MKPRDFSLGCELLSFCSVANLGMAGRLLLKSGFPITLDSGFCIGLDFCCFDRSLLKVGKLVIDFEAAVEREGRVGSGSFRKE